MTGSPVSEWRWTWLSERPVLLARSRVGLWQGFEFQEIRVSDEGHCDGAASALHLSQACGPIKVRAPGRGKLFVDYPICPILHMPDRHRRGYWQGAERGLHLFVEPNAFERLTHLKFSDQNCQHLARLHPAVDPLLRALLIDTRSGHPCGSILGEAVVTAILQHLVGDEAATASKGEGPLSNSSIRRIIELIDVNLTEQLRLQELADEAGLSVRHFSRAFRATMGCSPYRYILQRRVERARDLIQTGRFGLCDVAILTGFAHQAHMADTFRKILGVPPSHFCHGAQPARTDPSAFGPISIVSPYPERRT